MATFRFAPNADINGTHLIGELGDTTWKKIVQNFSATGQGYADEEKGYQGDERTFKDSRGRVYNVYTRWGVPRLGGRNLTALDLKNFEAWVAKLPSFPATAP